jgi:predicted nucleic acid-binding protein
MEMAFGGQIQAFITPSIVHIVGHYCLTNAFVNAKAKELLLTLLTDFYVIEIDQEITLHALHSKIKDIEDALQYYTAMHHKVDYFITRDNDMQKESISVLPVYTPEEFLEEFLNL